LALQDLQSLEDEPAEKMMVALHNHHYPAPLGRDPRGTKEGIEGTTIQDVRDLYSDCVHPENTIMSVAGNVEWVQLLDQVGKLFGDWQRRKPRSFILGSRPGPRAHLSKETEQTQIGVAYESVPIGHPQYYAALGAVKVLSGGMSARLFTEIREKEGLCYAVSARYLGLKDRGSVICYAGSRNDRAQRTLDLLLHELNRLKDGIADDEVIRLKAGLKSSLIMQQESTFSRAGAIASDWYHLGRVRTLEEIQSAVDSLTPERIVSHVREYPPREFTIVTLGPSELQVHASE
jgi:predicted Zn-dependent peptidase